MFHQQHHELFTVHQGDGSLVVLSCFLDGSGTEITGGDDQSLLVRSETAAHLLNHRGQDVVLELPFLDLDGHLDADHVTDHQGAPDIDAAVAAELGHLDHLEAHLRQQLRDKLLELTGLHNQQALTQRLPNLVVVLLDLECETASHPLAQSEDAHPVSVGV